MGFFFDSYEDCIDKYASCERSGDYSGAEKYILKAFDKKHDDSENGALYYLLSLMQFEQDKIDIGLNNMSMSANLGEQGAIEFINEYNASSGDADWLDSFLDGFLEGAVEGVVSALLD